jgi:hypothetical protein
VILAVLLRPIMTYGCHDIQGNMLGICGIGSTATTVMFGNMQAMLHPFFLVYRCVPQHMIIDTVVSSIIVHLRVCVCRLQRTDDVA